MAPTYCVDYSNGIVEGRWLGAARCIDVNCTVAALCARTVDEE